MQSRVKFGSFLRGIVLGSTAFFAASIVPAQAQEAAGQTVITAARYIDVLTRRFLCLRGGHRGDEKRRRAQSDSPQKTA